MLNFKEALKTDACQTPLPTKKIVPPLTYKGKPVKKLSEVNWAQETRSAHTKIYQFHMDLNRLGFRHLFFNTYNHFNQEFTNSQDWHNCYVDPYDPEMTFYRWCINNGFKTVNPGSYHFGADAHLAWAEFLIKYYYSINT